MLFGLVQTGLYLQPVLGLSENLFRVVFNTLRL